MRRVSLLRPPRLFSRCLSPASSHYRVFSNGSHPINESKPYYITTPIFYPNSGLFNHSSRGINLTRRASTVPHIGHLHSLVIADVLARYAKLAAPSRTVKFMTGTDEHGLKIQKAAEAKGMQPLAFCDELSEHFRVSRLRTCGKPQRVMRGRNACLSR